MFQRDRVLLGMDIGVRIDVTVRREHFAIFLGRGRMLWNKRVDDLAKFYL